MQGHYIYFWSAYFAVSLILLWSAWHLTFLLYFKFLRQFSLVLLLVFLWAPAPVPDYAGQYAPAFIVAAFETFLRNPGQPAQSLEVLQVSLAASAGLMLALRLRLFSLIVRPFRRRDPFDGFR